MAEIKSTMERVMERVAQMGAATPIELDAETQEKEGMRLAACFMRDEIPSFDTTLDALSLNKQVPFKKGIATTLLRNLSLPRDVEQLRTAEKATTGLMILSGADAQISAVLSEVRHILSRYQQHRDQLRKQLEEAMRQQLQQAMEARAPGSTMTMSPTMHPQFQEEWKRIVTELDSQYGNALDHHKESIRALLA